MAPALRGWLLCYATDCRNGSRRDHRSRSRDRRDRDRDRRDHRDHRDRDRDREREKERERRDGARDRERGRERGRDDRQERDGAGVFCCHVSHSFSQSRMSMHGLTRMCRKPNDVLEYIRYT